MILENFVVMEGVDGSGTSTQIEILRTRFAAAPKKTPVHICFEPTEGPIGTLVRAALRRDVTFTAQTIARLFAADRDEHLNAPEGIIARVKRGELVVCDRYVPSSLVYQGLDCGDDLPARLNADFPYPQFILYFDIDPEVATERFSTRDVKDVYEQLDFQHRVKERYEVILPTFEKAGSRIIRIDASQSKENVAEQVWSALVSLPILEA